MEPNISNYLNPKCPHVVVAAWAIFTINPPLPLSMNLDVIFPSLTPLPASMDLEAKWMAKVRLAGTPIQKKKKSTLHNYSTPGS